MKRVLVAAMMVALSTAVLFAASWDEDWDCSNSESPNCDLAWTEVAGDVDIIGNTLYNGSGSFVKDLVVPSTPLSGVNQYLFAVLDFAGCGACYSEFVFRYTDSSSPYYGVMFYGAEDLVEWRYYDDAADTTATSISSGAALTVSHGDVMGVTLDGTGTATVVRIWLNPTGTPSAADNWNGDTTPDVTFTDDPGSPINTGNNVGFEMFANGSANMGLQSAGAGDLGGGGGGGPTPKRRTLLGVGKGH